MPRREKKSSESMDNKMERMLLQNDLAEYRKQLRITQRELEKFERKKRHLLEWINECERRLAALE